MLGLIVEDVNARCEFGVRLFDRHEFINDEANLIFFALFIDRAAHQYHGVGLDQLSILFETIGPANTTHITIHVF